MANIEHITQDLAVKNTKWYPESKVHTIIIGQLTVME